MTINEPNIRFKLVIPHQWSNKQKGTFWETVSADLFRKQRWKVTPGIEFEGMQTDIYIKHLDTDKIGLIECKFQQEPINAPTIYKLMGQALHKKVDFAYLLSNSDLNAKAKAVVYEYNKEPNKPFSLVIWSSDELAKVFMDLHNIKLPNMDEISGVFETITLLVTDEKSFFWVAEEMVKSNSPNRAIIFPTHKSKSSWSSEEWKEYFACDEEWKNLEITVSNQPGAKPKNELINQSISEVEKVTVSKINQADSFDDYYHPSRPEDFFGRETHQEKFWEFVKNVRDKTTDLRVVSFSGNTGLGKSSLVLKLASECGIKSENKDKKNVYIYHVDVTSVNQKNANLFVIAAITKGLQQAINIGFVDHPNQLVSIDSESPYFDNESIRLLTENLKNTGKVIVIFFDQFEEILTKDALSSLYGLFKEAAYYIDSLKKNIVLGFCWRTDINIPPEHPAYSTWEKLQYRLKNINLAEFSESESLELLDGFNQYVTTQKDKELEIITKASLLRDNLSGQPWFNQPWYLKQKCSELYNQNIDQSKLEPDQNKGITKSDIETSFDKDLEKATVTVEHDSCLKYIAKYSPVSKMDVCSKFNNDVISSILKSKLVIKIGKNYKIYCDIFREFMLDGKLPVMIISYRPRTKISTAWKIFKLLNSYKIKSDLVRESPYEDSTVDNAIGDLQKFFQVTKDQESGEIIASEIFSNLKDEEIAEKLAEQIQDHVIIKKIYEQLKPGEVMWLAEFQNLLSEQYNLNSTTASDYASKMLSWFHFAGLLEERNGKIVRPNNPKQGKQKGKPENCEPTYALQPKSTVAEGQPPLFDISSYRSRHDD
jgi:hypothetical protein